MDIESFQSALKNELKLAISEITLVLHSLQLSQSISLSSAEYDHMADVLLDALNKISMVSRDLSALPSESDKA